MWFFFDFFKKNILTSILRSQQFSTHMAENLILVFAVVLFENHWKKPVFLFSYRIFIF